MLRGHHRFFSASWPGTASSHTHSPISAGPLPTSRPRKNEHDHDPGSPIEGVGGHQAAPRVPRVGAACRDRKTALMAVDGRDAARAEGAPHDHVDGFVSLSQLGPSRQARNSRWADRVGSRRSPSVEDPHSTLPPRHGGLGNDRRRRRGERSVGGRRDHVGVARAKRQLRVRLTSRTIGGCP